MNYTTKDIRPRAATFPEAMEHAANRFRLACLEEAGARRDIARLQHELKETEALLYRCESAKAMAETVLCELARTGKVDAYCPMCDTFYAFEPHPDMKIPKFSSAPPCPRCSNSVNAVSRVIAEPNFERVVLVVPEEHAG